MLFESDCISAYVADRLRWQKHRTAVQHCVTTEEQIMTMRELINPHSVDNRGLTQLEQCARAPFGFWALVRKVVPVSYKGEDISAVGTGFSDSFLNALKTEKVLHYLWRQLLFLSLFLLLFLK